MSLTARPARTASIAAAAALALGLTACAAADEPVEDSTAGAEEGHDDHEDHDHGEEGHDEAATDATENESKTPRIVATYDGGIVVFDALSLEQVADIPLDGFNRLSDAGDGRHVAVSTTGGWAVLDAGTWSQPHGDHFHYYTAEPTLTDVLVDAEVPGHVVPHGELAALWDDGTGNVTVVEVSEWSHMVEEGHVDAIDEWTAEAPHHGVAVVDEAGVLYTTVGTEESRSGAQALLDGEVVASTDECPGVHGETAFHTSEDEEIVAFGCEDGVAVFHGDHVHKLSSPTAFGRIGNLFATDGNDIVAGDYKSDPEGGLGLSEISLIDPEGETITVVDPFAGDDATYTWRGLRRGDDGEVLVLGTDGALRVIDPATGDVTTTIPVIDPWEVPEEWQTAHPALAVVEGMAYVTDPNTGTITSVDYVGGEVFETADAGVEFNEVVGVTG
ncbi:hypothetical protein [Demequina sp. NBRC 110053]|uniref:hypothetical protein n=1 Tax=Demequina sp. NBRC 110053 TaxID=1570342 RepID=UPI001186FC5F|nr:hypothetical protein [Demequina sp. NBRC 110053]